MMDEEEEETEQGEAVEGKTVKRICVGFEKEGKIKPGE